MQGNPPERLGRRFLDNKVAATQRRTRIIVILVASLNDVDNLANGELPEFDPYFVAARARPIDIIDAELYDDFSPRTRYNKLVEKGYWPEIVVTSRLTSPFQALLGNMKLNE